MKNIRNIDKAFKVHPLLINSSNRSIKNFLLEYYMLMKSEGISEDSSDEIKRLDNCIDYLCRIDFETEGWMIHEIPVFYSHCFLNREKEEAFDLVVWDIGDVIIRYISEDGNEKDAKSIEDAILNYCMDGYI